MKSIISLKEIQILTEYNIITVNFHLEVIFIVAITGFRNQGISKFFVDTIISIPVCLFPEYFSTKRSKTRRGRKSVS